MGRLVYSAICSLDGHVNDPDGNFDWAAPDAEVHGFVNDRERGVGTYLYGRRMYEVMRFWQTEPDADEPDPEFVDYGRIWRAADKAVFSTTLTEVATPRTSLYRTVEPAAITAMKELSDAPISVGGPTLAAALLHAGLVDELSLYLVPAIVGGGLRALPDDLRVDLALREERTFANGTTFLRYDVR